MIMLEFSYPQTSKDLASGNRVHVKIDNFSFSPTQLFFLCIRICILFNVLLFSVFSCGLVYEYIKIYALLFLVGLPNLSVLREKN